MVGNILYFSILLNFNVSKNVVFFTSPLTGFTIIYF